MEEAEIIAINKVDVISPNRLTARRIEVAHLKLSLAAEEESGQSAGENERTAGLVVVRWVRGGAVPEVTRQMNAPPQPGRLLVNLRAEGEPDVPAADSPPCWRKNWKRCRDWK